MTGLSPRLRGNVVRGNLVNATEGSIPALAGERGKSYTNPSPSGVYPRACGGTRVTDQTSIRIKGLSPRLRGNAISRTGFNGVLGSIPALAGERARSISLGCQLWVYPRACGGTRTSPRKKCTRPGLSPRLRGNAEFVGVSDDDRGSIPALAGERVPSLRHVISPWVYPRACGGTRGSFFSFGDFGDFRGLSPRLRGNASMARRYVYPQGSIPALAGERGIITPSLVLTGVYPRACGGTDRVPILVRSVQGLSPRLRGNARSSSYSGCAGGSIPALAGERITSLQLDRILQVYPRACGGTASMYNFGFGFKGLSPRLRGNAGLTLNAGNWKRSIPALAGERTDATHWLVTCGVYPRACGGTGEVIDMIGLLVGLSPRLRGNAPIWPEYEFPMRSIPALAGERFFEGGEPTHYKVYPRACGGTPPPARLSIHLPGLSPRLRGNV